jgi:hypothetical protein
MLNSINGEKWNPSGSLLLKAAVVSLNFASGNVTWSVDQLQSSEVVLSKVALTPVISLLTVNSTATTIWYSMVITAIS